MAKALSILRGRLGRDATEQIMEARRSNTDAVDQLAHPDLRDWLKQLVASDRLAVAQKGVSLTDELAAVVLKIIAVDNVGAGHACDGS